MSPTAAAEPRRVPAAQEAALDGIEVVVSRHLAHEAAAGRDGPQVVLVDGRFRSEFVDRVARCLRDRPPSTGAAEPQPWAVVRFDAWQYQRLAPPWWWLITTMDRELQAARKGRRRVWARVRDYLWRIGHLLADMAPVLLLAAAAVVAWLLLGRPAMSETAKWLSAVVGGFSAAAALIWSGLNAVRGRLLLGNPANAEVALRTKDPMARLRERYEFLVRSADRPVIVVVDNLDRCSADYVVDLLEGIHTLLKPGPGTGADPNFVAFVVPADRSWLCDSFMQRYAAFKEAISEPGRPFGLSFVDKVFDVMLCLPRISPACARMPETVPEDVRAAIRATEQEMEIRQIVRAAEEQFARDADVPVTPVSQLRIDAVVQIGKTEAADECDHACRDTKRMLAELSDSVDVGPVLMNQLRDAYCVHRTAQFLGGHEIDVEDGALMRLGRWTVLDFRWPLLTAYLREYPEAIVDLQRSVVPRGVDKDLRPLFARGDPSEVAQGLSAETVRRFAWPLSLTGQASVVSA